MDYLFAFFRSNHSLGRSGRLTGRGINLSEMTNTALLIVGMYSSFLSVMNVAPIYVRAFEMQCRVLFTEAHTRDIVNDMIA